MFSQYETDVRNSDIHVTMQLSVFYTHLCGIITNK